jgi:sortase A
VPRPRSRTPRPWLLVERLAWATGLGCLALWGTLYVSGAVGAQQELGRFAAMRAASSPGASRPDLTLWSPQRIQAWQDTLDDESPAPLAAMRIPKIGLEVAVLPGTSDWTLNRAVGHIEGTVLPGTDGNSGIAGHRDGFFRGLKDVAPGDTVEVETLGGTDVFRIERIWIVAPEDVSVLDPTPSRAITLVTCYPFYYVGSAPLRYIVRAVALSPGS